MRLPRMGSPSQRGVPSGLTGEDLFGDGHPGHRLGPAGVAPSEPDEHSTAAALIPGGSGLMYGEVGGGLTTIAEGTIQFRADAFDALRLVLDPRSHPERWPVTNVLAVMAVEQRRPVTSLVDLELHDPP